MKVFEVSCEWDSEAEVWYVSKSDVPGLAADAKTVEKLNAKLAVMIPELLVLNGVISCHDNKHLEVPYELLARKHATATVGC